MGREATVSASLTKSHLWKNFMLYPLLENMRVEKNVPPVTVAGIALPFRDWVLSVGDGTEQTFDLRHDGDDSWIHIPKELQVSYDGDLVCAIVNEIYAGLDAKHGDIAYLRDRAILTPLNEYVEVINQEVLGRLPGKSKSYTSCDTICKGSTTSDAAETLYPTEYLNSLRFSGMPNHKIQLKIGAPIMLLRNLNPKKGLCNGTRLIVTRCYPFLIEAVIITGNKIGDIAYIPRITMTPADKTYPFVLKRKQFPVALSYAMTINKSQGQTMKNVGLYLPNSVFSHGQLYVAISRVTTPCGLKIVCVNEDQATDGYTKNVVYREIFTGIQCPSLDNPC
ncbi:ATP-dependent DNA helicase [Heracleum sosnowskyi]|uniref:ATP-dependent DNA helicase n=1 Tax=Heracleum sosnowskyi TaxID=360622 RepID=A0AAD8N4U9_9APIA|nr:ATP-dependent DNA helicase [Heracleum sosnowskyi]